MPDLRVIDGGRSLAPGEAGRIATVYDVDVLRRVRHAEKQARSVGQMMAPAFATISNTDTELVAMIAAADIDEAIAVAMTFAKAAAIARALADTLQAAEATLSAAIGTVVAAEGRGEQAKPPIR
jgi:hypothetical protein